MVLEDLKEAGGLLVRVPLLWAPGIAGGIFAAATWLAVTGPGAFLASRFLVIFSLILVFLAAGALSLIGSGETGTRAFYQGGIRFFFRVLLPQILLVFILAIVFILCTIVFTLAGLGSDIGLMTSLTLGIMLPTLMLAFFFDTAAVLEDQKVFDAIRRSILLVSEHIVDALAYYITSALLFSGVTFGLMITWEIILFDKLKPMMDFTDAEREAFTPEQLFAMIGPDGIWVTAAVIFAGALVLIPVLISYKACFYRRMAAGSSSAMPGQTMQGEYDSKGRWYKY